jgi:uncharacterized protein (DUF1697 family)
MPELCRIVENLGMREVRSFLQSGNVLFGSHAMSTARLEQLLDDSVARALGFRPDVLVRTAAEYRAIVAGNPFPDEAKQAPGRVLVMFLKEPPARAGVTALHAAIAGPETVRVKGRQAYIVYPDGIGRSRMTGAIVEKYLGTKGTGRNWNTVIGLDAMLRA